MPSWHDSVSFTVEYPTDVDSPGSAAILLRKSAKQGSVRTMIRSLSGGGPTSMIHFLGASSIMVNLYIRLESSTQQGLDTLVESYRQLDGCLCTVSITPADLVPAAKQRASESFSNATVSIDFEDQVSDTNLFSRHANVALELHTPVGLPS